ncbi:hypothetical protein AGABI1DRAFT_108749 [Agaricus bisporus var. burnettii JB137-S8]|uniref:BHLH domain-containing protein n=1 Tax=Agaricus bisporus var. burnettii (strain JB137-S8 / ATCC MYA-4627 / FGSC 10392) TaxID=597362 RepID=K5WZX5_AGABU|nr:uncharacterized protein AGABI1DRAFT_108749 [Agaricus bisporus var. burnettii JB137-S8]EKM76418.1 hypothetical protein AGABI1DRAFT_108749 [Agaricus bisporus var. burnettii JB137-S8]
MHGGFDAFRKFAAPDDFDDDMAALTGYPPRSTHNIFDISLQTHEPFTSSMRYEPHPFALNRHSPSRSRSRSRPPSAPRPTRARRGNSVSSTSSPPPARPQAILIPGTHSHHRLAASLGGGNAVGSQAWFMNSHSSPSDFSLPTPDSMHSHHHNYTPFSLNSPTDMHLPPLSHHHPIPQSVPKDPIGPNGTIINGLGINMSSPSSPPQTLTVVQSSAEKQAAIANEKRRRRRESHNAVERRRRDNINEKISELATLIPECMLDVGANGPNLDDPLLSPISPIDGSNLILKKEDQELSTSSPANETGIVKANKGMILRKSVEYIRYLQQLVTAQGARNRELESELKMYRSSGTGSDVAESESSHNMVLASESTANTGSFNGFTLPPTHEDDELMVEEGLHHHQHHHHHHHHHNPYRQQEDDMSSPEGSGMSNEHENGDSLERGRTRDVARRTVEDMGLVSTTTTTTFLKIV